MDAIRSSSNCNFSLKVDMLIDNYLSNYDVRHIHETVVEAEPAHAYRVLRAMNFNHSLVIRTLFAIRNFPAKLFRRSSASVKKLPEQSFLDFAQSIGWQILEELPDRELVCGAITKPWEIDVKFHGMSGSELKTFSEPGFTKIVWSMASTPEPDGRARVILETRVAATDESSRRKFKLYWFVFGPFIGLIRIMILRMLKREMRGS